MSRHNDSTLADAGAERSFLSGIAWQSQQDVNKARVLLEQSLVTSERLFFPAHRDVFDAIVALLNEGQPADAAVLSVRLKASVAVSQAGGIPWISELMSDPAMEYQIPLFSEAIRIQALRRHCVSVCKNLENRARDQDEDVVAALLEASKSLAAISLSKRSIRTLNDVLVDVIDELEDIREGKNKLVPTGFARLDAAIGGWQPTLCVIGALPGVGKSAILASTVQAMARVGRKVGLFSLEDEARWLGWRVLSDESGITQFRMRSSPLTPFQQEKVANSIPKIQQYSQNVVVDDRSALAPREVVQTARDMIVNHGCQAIIVDHLGELRFENTHAERYDLELMEGLTDLREIAKRYRIPVIVAAHLKRRQGLGPGDEPKLSDFANSSSIERQARLAIGLAREPDSETLTAHVLKQTNGRAGISVDLKFVGAAAMVRDCEGPIESVYTPDFGDGVSYG